MEPKYDVIAMGELLIDFTENGYSEQGNHILEANPGGAPCNVLAMLNRLGKKTSFLGMVGKDQFGVLLRDTLKELGIDTSHLYESESTYNAGICAHVGGRRPGICILQKSRCGYDAERRACRGRICPQCESIPLWYLVHDT